MINKQEIIISEQITLRQIIPLDANDIFTIIDEQRDYLGQWLPFVSTTHSMLDTEYYIVHMLDNAYTTDKVFTIRYDNIFIGIIGYKGIDEINQKLEIGYWISQDYQKRGIMTQSVSKLCDHAFTHMNINRIQIKCATNNIASAKIPKRLHFTLEGIERQGELYDTGHYFDLEVYSLLKEEYQAI